MSEGEGRRFFEKSLDSTKKATGVTFLSRRR